MNFLYGNGARGEIGIPSVFLLKDGDDE